MVIVGHQRLYVCMYLTCVRIKSACIFPVRFLISSKSHWRHFPFSLYYFTMSVPVTRSLLNWVVSCCVCSFSFYLYMYHSFVYRVCVMVTVILFCTLSKEFILSWSLSRLLSKSHHKQITCNFLSTVRSYNVFNSTCCHFHILPYTPCNCARIFPQFVVEPGIVHAILCYL